MSAVKILRWLWRLRYPVYAAGLVTGLAIMVPGFLTYQNYNSRVDQLRTEGIVVQATVEEVTVTENLRLRYVLDGMERWGEVSCWQTCHPVGAPVQIWVDPDDPDDFTTGYGSLSNPGSSPEYLVAVAGVWVVTGALVGILARLSAQWRDRRRHRHGQHGSLGGPAPIDTTHPPDGVTAYRPG